MGKIIDPKGSEQSIGSLSGGILAQVAAKRAEKNGEMVYAGGKITDPGIYAKVPMSVYHSDCCVGPSISSGGLRELTPPNGCPMRYWDNSYLNPNRAPEEVNDHFSLGKAVHTLLLSEEGFKTDYAIRPKEFKDWRTNDAKDWREKNLKAGKTILIPDDLTKIQGMAERISGDRTFVDLLRGKIERSIIWQDKKTGVWLKSRPDSIPADGYIADLKTTADASEIGCQRATLNHGYHMQLGLGCMGLEALTTRRVSDHVLLFIEVDRPWAYNIKPVDPQLIDLGMRQLRAAINVFSECIGSGVWPTYYGSGVTLSGPEWFEKQIDREPSIPQEAA